MAINMMKKPAAFIFLVATLACGTIVLMAQGRPRARDLGIAPGVYPPGPLNAITDVGGVRIGHTTVIEGDAVRTGVTAVLPHPGNIF
jgi:D-aminopeptidase